MVTDHLKQQEFQIVNHSGLIEGAAQFLYKGFQISFSTMGALHGACRNSVVIFGRNEKNKNGEEFFISIKDNFHTVQNAISYIDNIKT